MAAWFKAWVYGRSRLLGLWVRIPPRAWIYVSCECCVLSGRGLCDGLVPRPEESYRVRCVWLSVIVKPRKLRRPRPPRGCRAIGGKTNLFITSLNQELNEYGLMEADNFVGIKHFLKSALFWVITQCRVANLYRRFGTTYLSDTLSRNVGQGSPLDAA
jgi:hypothetical protein